MKVEFQKIASGNTADIYQIDDGKICKLFRNNYPKEQVKIEYANLKLVNNFEIPSAKVYELVEMDHRYGIIEDRIVGETLLTKIKNGADAKLIIQRQVEVQNKLLSVHSKECQSYKLFLKECMYGKINENEKEYMDICMEIDSLPDDDCLCHGDLHPDNIIVNEVGECFVIDFMNLCYGPKEYDIARSYFLISQGELPRNMPKEERKIFAELQKELGEIYLNIIQTDRKEIERYLRVISKCRKYEMM